MARAYTVRFLQAYTAGQRVVYSVPPGMRAVLRNVVGRNAATAAVVFDVWCGGIIIITGSLPATAGRDLIEIRAVAYAGELIEGRVAATGASLTLTGYLFEDGPMARARQGEASEQPPPPAEVTS